MLEENMPKNMPSFYRVVIKYLIKERGYSKEDAYEWVFNKTWSIVLRTNNFITRRAIIADYNYCEGKYVSNTLNKSSLVIL